MRRSSNFKALGRAMAVIGAVMVIVSSVTYAALQSQQDKLIGNSIETATTNLRIGTDGVTYGASHTGFDFSGIIPGGPAVPVTGNSFFLFNSGGAALALKLAVTSTPSNPDNVDLSQVNVILTQVGVSGTQSFSLQSLIDAASSGGVAFTGASAILPDASIREYKLQVSMNTDAVNGPAASLANIDFAISGVVQSS